MSYLKQTDDYMDQETLKRIVQSMKSVFENLIIDFVPMYWSNPTNIRLFLQVNININLQQDYEIIITFFDIFCCRFFLFAKTFSVLSLCTVTKMK